MDSSIILNWEEKQRHESLNDFYFEKGLERFTKDPGFLKLESLIFIGFDDTFEDFVAIIFEENGQGFTYFYKDE